MAEKYFIKKLLSIEFFSSDCSLKQALAMDQYEKNQLYLNV